LLISILLPVYNEKTVYLTACLNSIANQSYDNWECIIVIEGETRKPLEVVSYFSGIDHRFKIIKPKKRLGLVGSLNLGLKSCSGLLVARIDSDDFMHRHRLKEQVKIACQYPNFDVIGCWLQIIDNTGNYKKVRTYPEHHASIVKKFLFRSAVAHPAILYRKSAVEKVGGYNADMRNAEDLDLWLRMIKAGCIFYNIPKVLTYYRENPLRSQSHWEYNLKTRLQNRYIFGGFKDWLSIIVLFCFSRVLLLTRKTIFK